MAEAGVVEIRCDEAVSHHGLGCERAGELDLAVLGKLTECPLELERRGFGDFEVQYGVAAPGDLK